MMSEDTSHRAPPDGRKEDSDFHATRTPSQQNGPSPLNDGPELLRDNHC